MSPRMLPAVSSIVIALCTTPMASSAQVSVDMTRVTCKQYLGLPLEEGRVFNAWMSGWFNQKSGSVSVDLNTFSQNVQNVREWCSSNLESSVMAGLTRATQKK